MPADQSLEPATRLFATTPVPAFVVDLEGRIVYWNRAAGAFFGVHASEALGRPCTLVVRGLGAAGEIRCTRRCPVLARARQDDSYSAVEMQLPTMPRPARWRRRRVHHLPLEDDSGHTSYVLHLVTNTDNPKAVTEPSPT